MERRKSVEESVEAPASEALVREKLPPCRHFLSTGSTLLDLAVSDRYPGGVGTGRVTQIVGDNSTAKTCVMREILGAAQRLGGYAIECDAEYTPDFIRAGLFGLKVGKWADEETELANIDLPLAEAVAADPKYCYRHPESVEGVFDREIGIAAQMATGQIIDYTVDARGKTKAKETKVTPLPKPIAIGIDTFTALPSEAEQKQGLDAASYRMERAKAMSAGFRKWLGVVARNDVAIIAVDHIRSAVGVTFGPDWTTSGGKAMQQYASTRIFLAHSGAIKNGRDMEVGIWVRAKIIKNKLAPPFREVRFAVMFDYGIDDIRSNLDWLRVQKDLETKLKLQGSWFCWGEEKLGNGIENAIAGVELRGLEAELATEVARAWKELYAPSDRKPREH